MAVNREACAKYKKALDQFLPPEWTEAVYTENAADVIDRPLVAQLQLSDEREADVRLLFKKADRDPKIMIVTDKLLTGYDVLVLYCMYLDKPMRDHVLLQAIARVNRPYVDAQGVQKRVGLVVDFVGVLRELKKALKFDSEDVSGVIEDLDVLLADFMVKIAKAQTDYLEVAGQGGADDRLEQIVFQRFLQPEARKAFYEAYKEIEILWEILSPSPELRDHIQTYKQLATLYLTVRNAYADKAGSIVDLAYKTQRLIQETATQSGLGRLTRSVTFDVKTLEAIRGEKGPDEGKVFNLVRGLQKEIDDDQNAAAILQAAEGSGRADSEGPGEPQHHRAGRHGHARGPRGGKRGRHEGGGSERVVDARLFRLLDAARRCYVEGGEHFSDGVRSRSRGAHPPIP